MRGCALRVPPERIRVLRAADRDGLSRWRIPPQSGRRRVCRRGWVAGFWRGFGTRGQPRRICPENRQENIAQH